MKLSSVVLVAFALCAVLSVANGLNGEVKTVTKHRPKLPYYRPTRPPGDRNSQIRFYVQMHANTTFRICRSNFESDFDYLYNYLCVTMVTPAQYRRYYRIVCKYSYNTAPQLVKLWTTLSKGLDVYDRSKYCKHKVVSRGLKLQDHCCSTGCSANYIRSNCNFGNH